MDKQIIIDKLETLDKLNAIKLNKIVGDWYSLCCPFHNNGTEKRPSSGVSLIDKYQNNSTLHKGTFHCFACGQVYNFKQFLIEVCNINNIDNETRNNLLLNIDIYDSDIEDSLLPKSIIENLNNSLAIDYISKYTNKSSIQYITEDELSKYRYTVPYMYQRGLTDDIICKYDVGVDLYYVPPNRKTPVPCITFPVKDNMGNVLFVARRSIEGKMFFLPKQIEKPVYGVYELPKNCKSLVITESIFNALTCVKYGRPAVCLFGTGTAKQIFLLKQLGVNEFILCFDGDDAGRRGTHKLKKALKSSALVWSVNMPDGKDLNDCDYDTYLELFSNLE